MDDVSDREGYLPGNGPHEGDELAGNGGDHDIGVLAAGHEAPEALAQPHLCLPADVSYGLGETLVALLDQRRELGRVTIGPGAFDQGASRPPIAGLGDGALAALLAAGMFRRDETDEGGELAWVSARPV